MSEIRKQIVVLTQITHIFMHLEILYIIHFYYELDQKYVHKRIPKTKLSGSRLLVKMMKAGSAFSVYLNSKSGMYEETNTHRHKVKGHQSGSISLLMNYRMKSGCRHMVRRYTFLPRLIARLVEFEWPSPHSPWRPGACCCLRSAALKNSKLAIVSTRTSDSARSSLEKKKSSCCICLDALF